MPSLMARLQALEEENRRLKKMVAEERLKAEMVQEALIPTAQTGHGIKRHLVSQIVRG